MEDRQCKGLCYNCDEKYVKADHYCEQNLFHIDVSSTPEIEDLDQEEPSEEETNEKPLLLPDTIEPVASNEEAIISRDALSSVSTMQIFKIKGYIKYHLLVVRIDSGSTHKFINRSKAIALHFIHSPS